MRTYILFLQLAVVDGRLPESQQQGAAKRPTSASNTRLQSADIAIAAEKNKQTNARAN